MKRNKILCNMMNIIKTAKIAYKAFVSFVAFSMIICITPANIAYANDANADSETNINVDTRARVPYLEASNESKDSKDNSISTDSNATLDLPGAHGYSSALVRVSVFNANNDTTVYVDGAPALQVAAKHDASQTVLAHVADGKLHVYASQAVQARVEVVAFLQSKTVAAAKSQKPAYVPGATVSLTKPVTRMDTNQKVSCTSMSSSAHCKVGLLGLGNIPGEYVRAAYVTMKVNMKNAGNVKVAGQEINLPKGDSVVSTIVVPSSTDGSISVESENATSAELYVRGWVAGAMPNMAHANVTGSFVPSIAKNWVESTTEKDKTSTVALGKQSNDSVFELALVSAHASGKRAFVEYGKPVQGRSTGAVVDAKEGALPQLDFVDTDATNAKVSARGSNVSSQVLMLGSILGSRVQNDKVETVTVKWTSPKENASIDFSKGKKLTISGTVDAASSVDYVNVTVHSSDNKTVDLGNAAVSYDAHGKAIWSMEILMPVNGKQTLHARAVIRKTNSFGTDSTEITTTVPDKKKTIISDKAKVVMPDELSNDITAVNPDSLVFNKKPQYKAGDILASTPGKNAPKGFLRKVVGVTQQGNTWVVVTEPAMLTDAIYQADISAVKPLSYEPNESKAGKASVYSGGADRSVDIPILGLAVTCNFKRLKSNTKDNNKEKECKILNSAEITVEALREIKKAEEDAEKLEKGSKSRTELEAQIDSLKKAIENPSDVQNLWNKFQELERRHSSIVSAELRMAALLRSSLHFDFDIKLDYGFLPNVRKFATYIKTEINGDIGIDAQASIEKSIEKEFGKPIKSRPIRFTIAGFPIIVTAELHIGFKADLIAKAGIRAGISTDVITIKSGFKYENNKFNLIREFDYNKSILPPNLCNYAKIEGTLGADAGPWIEPHICFYETFSIGLRIELLGEIEGDVTAATNHATAHIKMDLAVQFTIKGTVRLPLPKIEYAMLPYELLIKKIEIFSKSWDVNIGQCPVIPTDETTENSNRDSMLSAAGKAYKEVLYSLHSKYKFSDADKYYYSLWDINNDQIPELFVDAESPSRHKLDSTRVFSYDGKKLVVLEPIHHENGTMMFDQHHGSVAFLQSIFDNSQRRSIWTKTTYHINNGTLVKEQKQFESPRVRGNEIDSLALTAPYYSDVADLTELNKLVNRSKLTTKELAHEQEVLSYREKGYQVLQGTIRNDSKQHRRVFMFDKNKHMKLVSRYHGADTSYSVPVVQSPIGLYIDNLLSQHSEGELVTIAAKEFGFTWYGDDEANMMEILDKRDVICIR